MREAEALPLIDTVEGLEDVMTRPSEALQTLVQVLRGPLMVLGAGGKMGPTLAVLAHRAAVAAGCDLRVVAVSRFTDEAVRRRLEAQGVQTLACDLQDPEAVRALPDAENVVYLVGRKFGTTQDPGLTWAINTVVPTYVAARYPAARIVALSTGNVYPLVPVDGGGSVEIDALAPYSEYAGACVARERVFTYFSMRNKTPLVLVRLNYAVDLRYGVLLDLAQRIAAGVPIDVTMGYLNCIWQGDANELILRALTLAATPAVPLNLTGPDVLSVRMLAEQLGVIMGRTVSLTGLEADTALLSNSACACAALGAPPTSIETMLRWTAHWVQSGGPTLNKPTHFDVRDGQY